MDIPEQTIKLPDGSALTVKLQWSPPPASLIPADTRSVWVEMVRGLAVAAVNPHFDDRNSFPGGRGKDELVVYTKGPVLLNRHGVTREVIFTETPEDVGVLGAVLPAGAGEQQMYTVPRQGVLISGHGEAAIWLASLAKGSLMLFSEGTAPASPSSPAPPAPLPQAPAFTRPPVIATYVMDGVGHVSDLAEECNRLLVAFYQGTGLVEWGGDSPQALREAARAWKAKDPRREIVISLGGQGGKVDLATVPEGIAKIVAAGLPINGIDFDNEAFDVSPDQALAVAKATSKALALAPGDFITQFVPPGGPPVGRALACAVACQKAGFRVYFGQQGYETSITDQQVMDYTGTAVAALGQEAVLVGIMLNDSHQSWTPESAYRRISAVKKKWPKIGGVYLWESARAGTKATATALAGVLNP